MNMPNTKPEEQKKKLNYAIPFKHGQDGTHYACPEMMAKLGGDVGCCGCNKHDCQPVESVQKPVQQAEQRDWEKELENIWLTESGYQNENLPMAYDPIKKLIRKVELQARNDALEEARIALWNGATRDEVHRRIDALKEE
jgi:hypothetical protein